MTTPYIRALHDTDATDVAEVGGKAANLGELAHLDRVRVPDGFAVTTAAFRRTLATAPDVTTGLDTLAHASDPDELCATAARIRDLVAHIPLPADVATAVTTALAADPTGTAYAVRSSATAEDLPTASFAGQQDTYLNVIGAEAVLKHISRCWASLFTDRAVAYRRHNGIDHRTVHMAVVVQRMLTPHASGILFTADPVTGNRTVSTVDAAFGLGEALVSGQINPDVFTVRDDTVVTRTIAAKDRALHARPGGGTRQVALDADTQRRPALTDAQAVELAHIGRRVEAHFGRPQDIEWCLTDDGFHLVQSRPITTLFPIPDAPDDGNRVYVSVGHGQMMTDPMKPLGRSVWQLLAMVEMHAAGGRLFVDVTPRLANPATRDGLLAVLGQGDPLLRDALETVLARADFPLPEPAAPAGPPPGPASAPPPPPLPTDPAVVAELIARDEASLAALERDIATRSGPALFDFLLDALAEQKRLLTDPRNHQAIMAGMDATQWLNEHLEEWLGERNAADTLTLSAPGNITSQMGLDLLDLADVVRPHPQVIAYLRDARDDRTLLDGLADLDGGPEARDALAAYLDRYGRRCVAEIDLTRPRWSERPTALVPALLDNVRNFEPGAAARRFEEGRRRATAKEREVLSGLRELPDGDAKADETKRMIDRVVTFIGYREYPKYGIVGRLAVYKRALLAEAERLVQEGVLADVEDAFHLTFDELRTAVATRSLDPRLVRRRKDEFRAYEGLTPPRVLTSDGEALSGAYRRDDVPAGALPGLPVSAGTVEGRARVVLDLADAELAPGDILVTTFTDPSWSPLFLGIAGLVTEVGGLMTHGAVIAREYGLPAVVGLPDATRLIRDGQRIRVHGTDGYVELLT
ncbi:rifamycin-inactivating phosphotransferase [Streptomyces sp. NPDC060194]|uniref:rifamycin-inactivating phosphotransferase n=1 Tax=Streptomyces sp. NPDC060194 TaxID=3347069 RepID=UPI00365AF466